MSGTVSSFNSDYQLNNKLRDIYQTVFMIQKILIVHQETSLPVFEKDIESTVSFNAAMISGVLQAISTIGQEMIGRPTGFKKLQFHGFAVTGSYFDGFTVYVFSETELVKEIEKGMQDLIKWFSKTFNSKKNNWDGSLDVFKISSAIIESKISQNLFLWLLYPFKTTKDQNMGEENLSILGKQIFECIEKDQKFSAALILDHFKTYDEEEILFEIFNLVINGYIETTSNDN
ncbi:MAG: hypothetical protein H7644_10960 [Candidatus Heimdallarchaeota archaeon]|nr:hypothetical protein [Candidatus Heimdallarchaeota archaeon]MCK5144276.1 hypothetical protein [Candidatus Heimdallarchaeota archaeon]